MIIKGKDVFLQVNKGNIFFQILLTQGLNPCFLVIFQQTRNEQCQFLLAIQETGRNWNLLEGIVTSSFVYFGAWQMYFSDAELPPPFM